MKPKHLATPVALALTVALLAAAASRDASPTSSSCTSVLDQEVCTWVVIDGAEVTELGATIPIALVESVPADAEMVWPPQELASVAMPVEARQSLGIDHLGINWEAHGHPPTLFMTQHFDFHFYNVTQAEIETIDCTDEAKPAGLPAHYALPDIEVPGMGVLVGLCVPLMGMHAMPAHDVHETDAFTASMMLGYYRSKPIFFEPMVSRDLLLSRSDFSLDVPRVQGLPAGVSYPRTFRAEYDAGNAHYRLIFEDFYAR